MPAEDEPLPRHHAILSPPPMAGVKIQQELTPSGWGRLLDQLPTLPPRTHSQLLDRFAVYAALLRAAHHLRHEGHGGYDREQAEVVDAVLQQLQLEGRAAPRP